MRAPELPAALASLPVEQQEALPVEAERLAAEAQRLESERPAEQPAARAARPAVEQPEVALKQLSQAALTAVRLVGQTAV